MDPQTAETQTKKPKPFSIESIIGTSRKSPEIDIENNLSEHSRNSEEDENEELNRMRVLAPLPPSDAREEKRESPVSVGSEESDAGEENTQGLASKMVVAIRADLAQGPTTCKTVDRGPWTDGILRLIKGVTIAMSVQECWHLQLASF
ncbi:hypothetical protein MSG28_014884 [Choristoneura fumiferana]|uniref:Uncharacterized protein n=1 Tax=Choristoneura fumiferana TaxID=7141 RepID=A0ACC0KY44_CHOFU|nr:hypothetical protein MSG28_014884 [Choristoneura fumiferana]